MSDRNAATLRVETLRQALTIASCATERRNTVPILGHLLISAEGGVLTATGTNMEERVTAYATGRGRLQPLTMSAHRANAILQGLPGDADVTLRHDDENGLALISGAGITAHLQSLPAQDFPAPRIQKAIAQWQITAGTFRDLFGRAEHAVSKEETRYYLNGVFLHVWDDSESPALRTAATDGHRLIHLSSPMPEGDTPLPMIVAKDAVRQLLKLLAETPDDATLIIKQGELSLRIKTPGWAHDSKAIDGTFPDFQRVIPTQEATRILEVHDPAALAALVQQARAIGTEHSQPVTFSSSKRHTFTISARSSEEGEATVQVPPEVAAWVPGTEAQVSFQARYLTDLCRALPEGFCMHVIDGTAPVRATSLGHTAVLMPMWLD